MGYNVLFNLIIKYKLSALIGLRYFTILNTTCAFSLVHRAYRLICEWFSRFKYSNYKGLHLWCTYFINTFKNTTIEYLKHNRITELVNHDSSHPQFWYFVIGQKGIFLILLNHESLNDIHIHFIYNKTRIRKVVDVYKSVHVHLYAKLCSDKNANKKDNSLLDLFCIFLQSLIKWLVSQKINRIPRVNFVLPNSCVNILYHTVSFKFKILFCGCVILHFLRALEFFLHNMIKLKSE